jgi:hypothetical protein
MQIICQQNKFRKSFHFSQVKAGIGLNMEKIIGNIIVE